MKTRTLFNLLVLIALADVAVFGNDIAVVPWPQSVRYASESTGVINMASEKAYESLDVLLGEVCASAVSCLTSRAT